MYARACAHLETQARRRAAEVVEHLPGLVAVLDPDWPVSHMSNRLLVTGDLPTGERAEEVLLFLDEAFAGRGLTHRKVDVLDDATAGRITPALTAAGFSHDEVLLMTAQPVPLAAEDPARDLVRVVDETLVRPLVRQGWEVESNDYSTEVVRQLVERRDALDRAGEVTRLVVLDPASGGAVAKADLLVADGVAEIDDVLTLPDHRGQGYASALVRAALDRAAGCDFVYLQAAAEDWPRHLYARLGFAEVGSVHEHSLLEIAADGPPRG